MSVSIVSGSGLFLSHPAQLGFPAQVPSSGSQLMDTGPSLSSPGLGAVCFPSAGKFKGKALEVGGSQKGIPFLLKLLFKELWWFL